MHQHLELSMLMYQNLQKLEGLILNLTYDSPARLVNTVSPIPILFSEASTNNVLLSTLRSLVNVVTLLIVAVPLTVRLEPAPVRTSEPVMVSPVLRTLSDAAPVKVAVIVPAEKFPSPRS